MEPISPKPAEFQRLTPARESDPLPMERVKIPPLSPPPEPLSTAVAAGQVRDLGEERRQLRNGYYRDILESYQTHPTRQAVHAKLEELRHTYEKEAASLFERQKVALASFTQAYNHEPNEACLAQLQQMVVEQDVGNSSSVIAEGRVQMVQAVYERRFELKERKAKLDEQIAIKWWDLQARYQRWKVERTLAEFGEETKDNPIEKSQERLRDAKEQLSEQLAGLVTHGEMVEQAKRLANHGDAEIATRAEALISAIEELESVEKAYGKAPTPAYLEGVADEISQNLAEPPRMLGIRRAKQLQKRYDKQLAWGRPELKRSLGLPSNWTSIRRFALKTHHNGELYTAITELEPAGDPITSQMRVSHKTRASNLWKETHFILGYEERTKSVKFRHGQFPTPEAAEEALRATGAKRVHVSSLLTASRLRPDYKLLAVHKKSLDTALQRMGDEAPTLILSNRGVNEGAVGTLKVLGMGLRLGWYNAITAYNNQAVDQLNAHLKERLTGDSVGDKALLRNLDGIVMIARRMNALWAKNGYADAGSDQFEMAALWSALDALLDITTMTNCMSGKDRTGEVSADTYRILDEVQMDLIIRDRHIEKEDLIFKESGLTKAEIVGQRIMARHTAGLPLDQARDVLLAEKLVQARDVLLGKIPFMARKKIHPGAYLLPGVMGISEERYLVMPRHTFYTPQKAENRQRDAENRRQNALGSGMLRINLKNTGRAGTKLRATDAKVALHSGFDLDYVLAHLADWARLVKIEELGPLYKRRIEERWHHEEKRALLKEIALEKTKMLRPMGKVRA